MGRRLKEIFWDSLFTPEGKIDWFRIFFGRKKWERATAIAAYVAMSLALGASAIINDTWREAFGYERELKLARERGLPASFEELLESSRTTGRDFADDGRLLAELQPRLPSRRTPVASRTPSQRDAVERMIAILRRAKSASFWSHSSERLKELDGPFVREQRFTVWPEIRVLTAGSFGATEAERLVFSGSMKEGLEALEGAARLGSLLRQRGGVRSAMCGVVLHRVALESLSRLRSRLPGSPEIEYSLGYAKKEADHSLSLPLRTGPSEWLMLARLGQTPVPAGQTRRPAYLDRSSLLFLMPKGIAARSLQLHRLVYELDKNLRGGKVLAPLEAQASLTEELDRKSVSSLEFLVTEEGVEGYVEGLIRLQLLLADPVTQPRSSQFPKRAPAA